MRCCFAALPARLPAALERFRPSLNQFCFSSSDPIQQAGGAGRSGATAKPPNVLDGLCLESVRAGRTCANSIASRLVRSAATPCVDLLDLGAKCASAEWFHLGLNRSRGPCNISGSFCRGEFESHDQAGRRSALTSYNHAQVARSVCADNNFTADVCCARWT